MTSTFPDVSISTDRLVLRPFEEADVPSLTEMMNDDLVTVWSAVPVPYTRADARDWVLRRAPGERTTGRGIVFAVTEFLTQRLVGAVRLKHTDWQLLTTEVSYVTAPWARGEGYASEAVLATVQWLFQDQKFERAELRTAADNTAAQQVAQRLGCISEGVLRNAWIARTRVEGGGWAQIRTDLLIWSLLPEDLDGLHERMADAGDFVSHTDWH
ncbi:GNAT family N-acetyltransferase [Streptomyces oceani]|uniref:Acetyltransferase n=1 Tax=Streptomyces oceani TaxID=1075402 RepID=A0A1E7JYF4_9ACTN|nr:GNAT family N-acetyltransferase [Streptomyces oceani]OEU96728.1 acetyltransferase [Streptomyces oceani]